MRRDETRRDYTKEEKRKDAYSLACRSRSGKAGSKWATWETRVPSRHAVLEDRQRVSGNRGAFIRLTCITHAEHLTVRRTSRELAVTIATRKTAPVAGLRLRRPPRPHVVRREHSTGKRLERMCLEWRVDGLLREAEVVEWSSKVDVLESISADRGRLDRILQSLSASLVSDLSRRLLR